jgi:hypothetical protein
VIQIKAGAEVGCVRGDGNSARRIWSASKVNVIVA